MLKKTEEAMTYGQSGDNDVWTVRRQWRMDSPETHVTVDTRHKTKQKTEKMSNTDLINKMRFNPSAREDNQFLFLKKTPAVFLI